jgi:hypothetical protein
LGLGDDGDGDDYRRRAGDGCWSGDEHDQRDIGVGSGLDGTDGDGGDAGLDRGNSGESDGSEGSDAAVYGDRYL